MKTVCVIHNPSAGDSNHSEEDINKVFDNTAYTIQYVSTGKKDWEKFEAKNIDIICAAGGDGTVRKVVDVILKRDLDRNIPIMILPLGTANNIASTLSIPLKVDFSNRIPSETHSLFDLGQIEGLGDKNFFLESVGFGIFPALIAEMQKRDSPKETPDQKLLRSLGVLLKITKDFKTEKARIKINGMVVKGKFLLVELMNIPLIGPNLKLAPEADVGDGYLNLVLIPKKNRDMLIAYLENRLNKRRQNMVLDEFVHILKVDKARIKYRGSDIHVDDNLFKIPPKGITVHTIPKSLGIG